MERNSFDDLVARTQTWAEQKGIFDADPMAQFTKIIEEIGELAGHLFRYVATQDPKYLPLIEDDLGDGLVTLVIEAGILGLDIRKAFQVAVEEIEGRNGITKNGQFVKEDDIKD